MAVVNIGEDREGVTEVTICGLGSDSGDNQWMRVFFRNNFFATIFL